MNKFTIKDIENLSGIKAHTIRIWEQRYNFLNPQRSSTNIRFYTNEELRTILNVALLNKYGYKISLINQMGPSTLKEAVAALTQDNAYTERVVNDLINYMIDVELGMFETTLNSFIAHRGIEKTISDIILPFMQRVGTLWITNNINPAQEHLVTNIIRQKIIVGIENCNTPIVADKTVMLFLPEGEHHELSLLYVYYLLKNKGISVVYLGSDVPLADVAFIAKMKNIENVYTHLTCVTQNFNAEKFFATISTLLPNNIITISGAAIHHYHKKVPKNIVLKKSFAEVQEYIDFF